MRAYFFGNMYLSSIQQGIQAKHCGDEMVVKYAPTLQDGEWTAPLYEQYQQLHDYLENHKTVICLNAGYSATLHEIYKELTAPANPYAFAKFHESEEALDGALTCVGIVLPEEIYEVAKEVRNSRGNYGRAMVDSFNDYGEWTAKYDGNNHNFGKWQVWLINELNNYGLAR